MWFLAIAGMSVTMRKRAAKRPRRRSKSRGKSWGRWRPRWLRRRRRALHCATKISSSKISWRDSSRRFTWSLIGPTRKLRRTRRFRTSWAMWGRSWSWARSNVPTTVTSSICSWRSMTRERFGKRARSSGFGKGKILILDWACFLPFWGESIFLLWGLMGIFYKGTKKLQKLTFKCDPKKIRIKSNHWEMIVIIEWIIFFY